SGRVVAANSTVSPAEVRALLAWKDGESLIAVRRVSSPKIPLRQSLVEVTRTQHETTNYKRRRSPIVSRKAVAMLDKKIVKAGDVVLRRKPGTALCSATTILENGVVPLNADTWGTLDGMREHAKAVVGKTGGQIHEQTDEQ